MKLSIGLLAACCSIFCSIADTSTGVSASDSWVVAASSQEEGFAPGLAIDGLSQTRWSSTFEDNQWLAVDLVEPVEIHSVLLKWEDAYARSYGIEVSDDGQSWTEVYATTKGRGGDEVATFDPVVTRWIRVDLRIRATEWGFSLYEVELNPELRDQRELIANVTASSGDRDYAPELAIDNDSNTRWSSIFTDDEWWQVEFKEPQSVGGIDISWEQAFAENYTIEVSLDGQEWQTVYTVMGGDGRTDLLFFEPVKTKFVRIDCTQRGTGWGNSIWEVDFFLDDQVPELSATSSDEEHPANLAMDGQNDTFWRSASDGEQTVTARLPEAFDLGGVVLKWDDAYPASYRVEGSVDGEEWSTLVASGDNAGGFDYHFFSAAPAQFIRVVCEEPVGGVEYYELGGIELKGGDEQATPLRHYTARARDAHPELYPMWLNRQQEFWTIIGLPEEQHETLLGETGMTEPKKGSFGVQPFVVRGDSDIVTWADVELEQHLAEDYLPVPSVTWKAEGWKLRVETIMSGPEGARFSAVRYRLINESDEPFSGKLALAIRPIQLTPGWQHGGFSPIRHATFSENNSAFLVDGEKRIELITPPLHAGAAALGDMEIGDAIRMGTVPITSEASDDEGKVGAAVTYMLDVAPGESADVVIVYPLYPGAAFPAESDEAASEVFDRLLAEHTALWKARLEGPEIDIPEKRFIDVLKSNLGYIMINRDGPFFKPGPRNYNHAWMRDGVLTGLATLRWGITDMVHDFIIEFAEHIRDDGWVPWLILESGNPISYNTDPTSGEGQEYDSQGQFPFIVRQYYDYTGDEELVRKVYPKVVSALKFARMLRERRMTEEYLEEDKLAYYGILPLSNSHEGYYPAKHSHWDNFWLIRGLKDAIYLADTLGHEDDAEWFRAELADVREKLYASMLRTINDADMKILPGCVELADTDPTSTSIAIMIAGEEDYLPQPYGSTTFEHYWGELHSRMQPGGMKLFTPYEVRNGDVFIRMGWRDRALAQFRRFTSDSTRPYAWNHMAEVVHATLRAPAYIGDMPHTWVGADYINAVRTMVAYEHGDVLVLAAGIDPAWLVEGVRIRNLPTQFGTISYEMERVGDVVNVMISGDADPTGGFILPVPPSLADAVFVINGESYVPENGNILFR